MRQLDQNSFNDLLKNDSSIKPRFKRDVRFTVSVDSIEDWSQYEIIPIYDKAKRKGILLLQPYDDLYMIAFESGTGVRDASSGRSKSVICDFCYTWRTGGDAGLVTFYPSLQSNNSIAQLCCLDLLCSQHVRTKTKAALMSRAQLREHMTDTDRIDRLKKHTQAFIEKLSLEPYML